jgi:bifunctional UDP-N-acetylglucosamine pyrophosphorylase/glucosamine-1-phosphate N-acetyltransferase
MSTSVVVLAAGKGTRMKTDRPKSLHAVAGRTLLGWALNIAAALDPDETSIVVGHDAEAVTASCPPGASVVIQEPQLGTGHAVQIGLSGLTNTDTTIVVIPGDMPLITSSSITRLLEEHLATSSAATIMSVVLDDPTGYGRVVRTDDVVTAIVEERDCSEDERDIGEVNTSVYAFSGTLLESALARVTNGNAQGEYYLTDVIGILVGDGHKVGAVVVPSVEGTGVNTQSQLAEVGAVLRHRINTTLMDSGVSMVDPATTYIDADVAVSPGSTIMPSTILRGSTSVASGARVGPNVEAHDSTIGPDARVWYSVLDGAEVGERASVGPNAYLRPGAVLKEGAKAGAYVEIKASVVGRNSKVPHLSYVGDAEIGEDTNIGAATVTVNYDGFAKHKTKIGDRVRIGSDTMLVAPIEVGDDAYTGAGSVITDDVPEGALGVERSAQRNIEGYADKHRKRSEEKAD